MINLDPGTTYHYAISAENKVTGYWQTETGTFKTLRRVVSVFFEEITMWDDSDDFLLGMEWTQKTLSYDVGPNVNEANPESFKQTFTIPVVPGYGISELSFKVTGSYSVTFVR